MTGLQAIALLFGYALGAVPFGYLIAKRAGVDIFSQGSGNIGATNVMRVLGRKAGITVFALDVAKGIAPPIVARSLGLGEDWAFFAGVAAILGHVFSPFLKFKGGKGIATSLGALIGSIPLTAAVAFGFFIVVVALTRYISLGSVLAAVAVPILSYLFRDNPTVTVSLIPMALLLILKHKKNIERLLAGTESKFTFGKQADSIQPEPGPDSST